MGRLGFCRLYGTNEAYLQRGIGMRVIWPDRESFIVERGCLGIERVCRIICRLSLKCLSTRSSNLFPPNKTCTTWEGGGGGEEDIRIIILPNNSFSSWYQSEIDFL